MTAKTVTTPDGKVASIRVPTLRDVFESGWLNPKAEKMESLMRLSVLCVTVDGQRLTPDMFSEMPFYEANAIMEGVVGMMSGKNA